MPLRRFSTSKLTIFSFRTIKAGVHFRNVSAERKIFNFVQAHLLKHNNLFSLYWNFFFPFWSWKKIQLQNGINYSIVLSANEIAECNELLNKTKTVKHRCEKLKCLLYNSWSSSFSFLTKGWNSPFECLSIKISCTHNLFFLILFFSLKFKRSNSQSIRFLAEIFGIVL